LDWDDTHGKVQGIDVSYHAHDNLSLLSLSPGRVFAANMIKALLAHMVVTYEMKFEKGNEVPADRCIFGMRIPGHTNVMFRRRQR
jgi:hypothetical protein